MRLNYVGECGVGYVNAIFGFLANVPYLYLCMCLGQWFTPYHREYSESFIRLYPLVYGTNPKRIECVVYFVEQNAITTHPHNHNVYIYV